MRTGKHLYTTPSIAGDLAQVLGVVAQELDHRVPTELFERSARQYDRSHRISDHPRRQNRNRIGPLDRPDGLALRHEVD